MSRLPSARTLGTALGAMRLGVGVTFLAAPVTSLRILGVDTATATRVTWLSRMTAARDAAIGAGTLASSARGGAAAGWIFAGAMCDAADAAALAAALRTRRVGGVGAVAMVGAAVASAAIGGWAAVGSARR